MKFRKMLSGVLAFALAVTSAFAGNVSTVKAEGPVAADGAVARDSALAAGDYYIINTKTGGFLNGGNSWGTQASALTYGELLKVVNEGGKTYIKYGNGYMKIDGGVFMDGGGTSDSKTVAFSIEPSGDGSYTIAREGSTSEYLTASADNTVVAFAEKSEYSNWRFLTRDQFLAEAQAVSSDDGFNVTSLIADAGFTRNNPNHNQWKKTSEGSGGGFAAVAKDNAHYCYEAWSRKFEISQEITGIPNGIYELNVQGAHSDVNYSPVYYINGTEHEVQLMAGDMPTDKNGFVVAFDQNKYWNTPIRAIVTDGKLTVGIKLEQAADWVIWDAFSLKYRPLSNEGCQEALDQLQKPNILGTNQGYKRIRSNLDLQTDVNKTLNGMGASIVWTSSNPAVIGDDGVIQAAAQNGDTAVMTAKLTLSGSTASKEWTYPVRIAKSVLVSPDDAIYDFNDGLNGAAVLDGATYRLDDYEGEVTYAAGRSNEDGDKALSMDGSYGLELPHYNLGDTWTVSMWYCPQADTDIVVNSQLLFVGYGEQPGEQKWLGVAGKDGDTASYKIWASGSVKAEGTGDTHKEKITPVKGKWNMLTITQDADKRISVYENGALLGQNTDYTEAILSGDNRTVYIGTNFWDPGFKGLIDDVTVSNKAFTEDEVAEAYLDSATAEDLKAALEKQMLGENKSLQKVTKDLTIPDTYLGKTITWTNSNGKALTIEDGKATVAANGKLPENTTLTYKIGDIAIGTGTFEVQAGTEEAFDRQEFFSKEEAERKDYVKAEIKKDFLNGNQSEKLVISDLKLLLEVTYKKAVIAGIGWSSSDEAKISTTETPGTGKVKYDKNVFENVTLTATVSPDDGTGTTPEPYSIPFKVKVIKPAVAAPTDMGSSCTGSQDDVGGRRDSGSAQIEISGARGSKTADGSATNAPAIADVSFNIGDKGGVGSDRIGYLVFNLAPLLKGNAGTIDWTAFDPETVEYANLKLHVNSVHANLGNGKMKIGLYLAEADTTKISNTDPDTYPAVGNDYGADAVTWCEEWLVVSDTNKDVTFDVKKLVLAAAEKKQNEIVFRVQVPDDMVYVAGRGDSNAANHPSLTVRLKKNYTDAEKIEEDMEELSTGIIPDKLDEGSALTLPAEIGEFKSQVAWTSDNEVVKLEKDEENKTYKVTVTRPTDQDVDVTLTAKVTNGGAEAEPITYTTKVEKYMTGAELQGKLIAGFTFDDAETGLSGNGASAAVKGNRFDYSTDGKFGNALYLGANTWLEVTKDDNSALLKGKEEITVSYYSKSNFDATQYGSWTFFAARDGNNFSDNSNRHYLALMDAKNAVKAERYDGNSGHWMEKTGLDNKWRKVDLVVTKDKTVLYIDGEKAEEKSDGTQALTKILGAGGGIIYIGKATWGNGEYYNGLLDEYKIYDRALTEDEVSRMYQRDAAVPDADAKLAEAEEALGQPSIDTTEDGVDTITFADTFAGMEGVEGLENCSIKWTIPQMSEIEILEAGKKIQLTRGNAAVTFKVTATITYRDEDLGVEKSVTKEFTIEIPKIGDKTSTQIAKEDVAAAKAELQTKTLTVGADDKITLPQTDSAGKCTIKWTAPEGSAIEISADGKTATATRGDSAAQVKLTAQITHKKETSVKDSAEITVTVPALTPQQRAERDVKSVKEALEAPVINADDTITFKTEDTEHNCTIAWTAPEGSAVKIAEDGKTATVTRGTTDQNVKLTATITSKTVTTVSDTKELTITITKLDSETAALRGELAEGVTAAKAKLEGTKAEDYPAGVWQALSDAIEAADKASKSGTKEEAAEAKEALEKALANFKTPAEVQEILAEAIGEAEELDSKAYTEESYQKYSQALEALKGLSGKADLTAAEVAEAAAALKAADEGLVVLDEYKPSEKQKEDLGAAITDAAAVEEKDYKQDGNWTAFQAALKKAQAVSSKSNATKDQVEKAINDLKAAKAKLTPASQTVTANKTALKTAITAAEKLVKKTYTASTWKAFQTALTTAKNIYAKANATQKEIDDAVKALNAKQKALKKAVTKITVTDKATGSKAPKIAKGKKVTLKVAVAPAGASSSVTYSIAKKQQKYATVNKKGVVTTKKAGAGKTVTVTVTAKDGSKKKTTIKISIMKNAVTKITLKAAKKVKAGKAVTIKATVKTNGKKANKAVIWSIDKKSAKYASINKKGKLTTKKTGKGKKVTVTATSTDGTNKKAKVTITLTK